MKCPHCLENFHGSESGASGATGLGRQTWQLNWTFCPACENPTIRLRWQASNVIHKSMIFPRSEARAQLPETVPARIAGDFREAVETLPVSSKASAALSRRLLQQLLREYGKVKPGTLEKEIEQAMPDLPSYLANAIDAVRQIGNFAAHPIKSESTGEIVEVEPGEAEWLIETVEALIDFYIVRPEALIARRETLNEKLTDAGKPELKGAEEAQPPPALGN